MFDWIFDPDPCGSGSETRNPTGGRAQSETPRGIRHHPWQRGCTRAQNNAFRSGRGMAQYVGCDQGSRSQVTRAVERGAVDSTGGLKPGVQHPGYPDGNQEENWRGILLGVTRWRMSGRHCSRGCIGARHITSWLNTSRTFFENP
jgi:hypothetical protein